MRRRRLPIGLIAPVALLALVVSLGVLQWRWVGRVSERERDLMQQSLDRRAREFADDFDREITRAYDVLKPEHGFTTAQPDRFAKRFVEWQAASRFPGFVKWAYFAETADDVTFKLSRFQ